MTLRDAKRICDAQESCYANCPLYCYEKMGCVLVGRTPNNYDIIAIEKACSKWLKEHPEPIFPTYYSWLISEGVYDYGERISPEFAKKYGVKPIENASNVVE